MEVDKMRFPSWSGPLVGILVGAFLGIWKFPGVEYVFILGCAAAGGLAGCVVMFLDLRK
jgi:hypothetical protein